MVKKAFSKTSTHVTACDIKFKAALEMDGAIGSLLKDEQERSAYIAAIAKQNQGPHNHDLCNTKEWDVAEFDAAHLPTIVGELEDKQAFSRHQGLRILDMAIYMPEQGWVFPKELEQFQKTALMAYEHEKMLNPDVKNCYVYITVDQKLVEPNKTQRRPGYHSDAYETNETADDPDGKIADNTYVVYDAIPTLFQPGPFPLQGVVDPENCDEVLRYFDTLSEGKPPVTYPAYALLKLTPYDIHTPALNLSNDTVQRTFVKVMFSKKPFNLIGNKINDTPGPDGKPILDYSGWEWVPRDPVARNHRNRVVNWQRPDAENFMSVAASDVRFNAPETMPAWIDGAVFNASRVRPSKAERATAGESLLTTHDNFQITYNIAQEGDWKITTESGSQYFISDRKFRERYNVDKTNAEGLYMPQGTPQKCVRITKDICLRASWGAMQYLPAGSILTRSPEGDIYGIHKADFEVSYQAAAGQRNNQAKPQALSC